MNAKQEIKLGMEVMDIVSGFKGIATSRTEYLNGCVRFCVEPKVKKDGSVVDSCCFDIQQLQIVKTVTPATKVVQSSTGGPRPNPRGPKNPPRR